MVIILAMVTVWIMASVVVIIHWFSLWLTDLWRAGYTGYRLLDDGDSQQDC